MSPIARMCVGCGQATRHGSRCRSCATVHERLTHNRAYDSIAWRRLRGRLLAAHVGRHGWQCPGLDGEHPPHPSTDLTIDHVVPLRDGGELLDVENLRVLCRSANSARRSDDRGRHKAGDGAPHTPLPVGLDPVRIPSKNPPEAA